MNHRFIRFFSFIFIFCTIISNITLYSYAANTYEEEMEQRKSLPIQSNDFTNWPEGPQIGAESAILMEMNTHTILYAKNIDEKLYPASTTKILTSLIAAQNCDLDETVSFSQAAVHDVPRDASNMGMDTGEELTMEQALYGVLVASANEAASAVGEHVAAKLGLEPTASSFASIMNEKSKELGCKNSHFMNANGLFDENHYTTAYDLALIGCNFFQNEMLCQMSSTPIYHISPSSKQPDDIWISSKNKLLKTREFEYPYLLGSKTGYVEQARQTLVSAAAKDGLKLVCVVFKEETPSQFTDTIALFEYGFTNFQKLVVSDYEKKYNLDNKDFFSSGNDLFGNSNPLLSLDKDAFVIIPRDADFSDLSSEISYTNDSNQIAATILYKYYNQPVGFCPISFSQKNEQSSFSFEHGETLENTSAIKDQPSNIVFINIKNIIGIILLISLIFILLAFIIKLINSYNFTTKGESKRRRKTRRKEIRKRKKEERANNRTRKRILKKRKKEYKKRKKSS